MQFRSDFPTAGDYKILNWWKIFGPSVNFTLKPLNMASANSRYLNFYIKGSSQVRSQNKELILNPKQLICNLVSCLQFFVPNSWKSKAFLRAFFGSSKRPGKRVLSQN